MAEKTDASAKGNDPNPEKGGVDAAALLEKVGKLLKDEAGFDLDEYLSIVLEAARCVEEKSWP